MTAKILIVDDEPNIVVPLQFLMEQNGYEVRVAETGEAAIEEITRFRPDLILLDIMLPGIDGFELCQSIKEDPDMPDSRILFISALGREIDIAKGLAMGGDGYISKPFSNTYIISRVKHLLES